MLHTPPARPPVSDARPAALPIGWQNTPERRERGRRGERAAPAACISAFAGDFKNNAWLFWPPSHPRRSFESEQTA